MSLWLESSKYQYLFPQNVNITLDDYYRINKLETETPYEFCARMGWKQYIDQMIAVDYLICNRDRHGANIEVLRNPRSKTLRIAPLFDHGLSLMYSCLSEDSMVSFDVLEDRRCNNFIGGFSCYDNLSLIYEVGTNIPLTLEDFTNFVRNTLDTGETTDLLECSGQNISYMVSHQRLTPIKDKVRGSLYLKGEVVRNNW